MRLLSMRVDGFGRICNARWSSLNPRLNVLLGPNEAGKTTLLNFIHAMLAGFPRTWRQHYLPVQDVEHGGSLQFRDASGAVYLVRRLAGGRGGQLELERGGRAVPDPEGSLAHMLGDMSPDTFRSIYTFGVDELHDLRLLEAEEISARIYSAGLGVPQLPSLLSRLNDEREAVFTTRARSRPIIDARSRIGEISRQIDMLGEARREYERGREKLTCLDERLSEIDRLIVAKQSENADVKRIIVGRQILTDLQNFENSLAALPSAEPVPPEELDRIEAAAARMEDAQKDLKALRNSASAVHDLTPTATQIAALEHEADIERLFSGRESVAGAETQLAKKQQRVDALTATKDGLIAQLGQGWSNDAVIEFPAGDARNAAIGLRARFDQLTTPIAQATAELGIATRRANENRSLLQKLKDEASAAASLPSEEAIGKTKATIREGRRAFDDLRRVLDQKRLLQQRSAFPTVPLKGNSSARTAVFWICFAGVIVSITSTLVLHGWVRVAAAVTAGLLAVITYTVRSRNASISLVGVPADDDDDVLLSIREQEASARSTLARVASELGIREVTHQTLDAIEDVLSNQEKAAQRAIESAKRIEQLAAELNGCEEQIREVEERLQDAELTRQNLDREWAAFRQRFGIPSSETPETALALIDRVRAAAGAVRDWRNAAEELNDERSAFATRTSELERLATVLAISPAKSNAARIDDLYRLLGEARTAKSSADQRRHLDERIASKTADLANAETQLVDLLRATGSDTIDSLRQRARIAAERTQLQARIRQIEKTLVNAVGPRDAFESLLRRYEAMDASNPEDRAGELERELASLPNKRDTLRDERVAICNDLAEIEKQDRTTELLDEKEQLIAKVQALAREWFVHTITVTLLEETKSIYERERKPRVIEHAERAFAKATGGTYPHIGAPTLSTELTVFRHDQSAVPPENLSRGTLEQLYLALRLGFIRQLAEQGITPPVVVDEILINADPVRAARIADGLFDLSETNQLLVFTCHRWVADLFRPEERVQDVKVIELEECL